MTVYFAQMAEGEERLIKIGFTEDVKGRLVSLSTSSPVPLTLIATVDGSRETERLIHGQLSDSRSSGEWFRPTEQVMALVASAKKAGQSWVQRQKLKQGPIYHEAPNEDLRIVTGLLGIAMGPMAGKKTKAQALQEVLPKLREINPLWTLRRLKSIQSQETTFISLWMFRDLTTLVGGQTGHVDLSRNRGE